jgi:hypothetical protein
VGRRDFLGRTRTCGLARDAYGVLDRRSASPRKPRRQSSRSMPRGVLPGQGCRVVDLRGSVCRPQVRRARAVRCWTSGAARTSPRALWRVEPPGTRAESWIAGAYPCEPRRQSPRCALRNVFPGQRRCEWTAGCSGSASSTCQLGGGCHLSSQSGPAPAGPGPVRTRAAALAAPEPRRGLPAGGSQPGQSGRRPVSPTSRGGTIRASGHHVIRRWGTLTDGCPATLAGLGGGPGTGRTYGRAGTAPRVGS